MAVELLVRMFDGPKGRKAGDIVSMKEVPHRGWGKAEGPPNYRIVSVDDTLKNLGQYYKRHQILESDVDGNPIRMTRSQFKLDLSNLPAADILSKIESETKIVITKDDFISTATEDTLGEIVAKEK